MSLQAILERIQAAGDTQVEAIQRQAEREVQGILADAQEQAKQRYDEAYRQALEPGSNECVRILNQARFETLRIAGATRENLIENVLTQVRQSLAEIRRQPGYPTTLKRILFEILPEQDNRLKLEEMLIIQADPRDQELLESLIDQMGLALRVEYNLNCWGGLNARSPDESIQLINTLESRFERVTSYLRQQLATRFESEQPDEIKPDQQEQVHVRL